MWLTTEADNQCSLRCAVVSTGVMSDVDMQDVMTWLHVKYNYFEIILK